MAAPYTRPRYGPIPHRAPIARRTRPALANCRGVRSGCESHGLPSCRSCRRRRNRAEQRPPRFRPTIEHTAPPPGTAPDGMVWIPGGEFSMGAADPADREDVVGMQATRDSRPVHRVSVDGFWMDRTEVTNDQFAAFVKATGYVTVAERTPRAEDFPGAPPDLLVAGSLVFSPPDHAVPLDNELQWWAYRKGANWRHPSGAGSTITGRAAIRSCTWPTKMRRPTRNGPASGCPRKRSGSSPRAAGCPASSIPGVMSSAPVGDRWPTAITATFPTTTREATGSRASRPWDSFRRTATGSSTSPETCGSG